MYYLKRGRERAKPEKQQYSRPLRRGTRRAVKSGPTTFGVVAGHLSAPAGGWCLSLSCIPIRRMRITSYCAAGSTSHSETDYQVILAWTK